MERLSWSLGFFELVASHEKTFWEIYEERDDVVLDGVAFEVGKRMILWRREKSESHGEIQLMGANYDQD